DARRGGGRLCPSRRAGGAREVGAGGGAAFGLLLQEPYVADRALSNGGRPAAGAMGDRRRIRGWKGGYARCGGKGTAPVVAGAVGSVRGGPWVSRWRRRRPCRAGR